MEICEKKDDGMGCPCDNYKEDEDGFINWYFVGSLL